MTVLARHAGRLCRPAHNAGTPAPSRAQCWAVRAVTLDPFAAQAMEAELEELAEAEGLAASAAAAPAAAAPAKEEEEEEVVMPPPPLELPDAPTALPQLHGAEEAEEEEEVMLPPEMVPA